MPVGVKAFNGMSLNLFFAFHLDSHFLDNNITIFSYSTANCIYILVFITAYLGADESKWAQYDATSLVATATAGRYDDILIDVGTNDSFYNSGALLPEVSRIFDMRVTMTHNSVS